MKGLAVLASVLLTVVSESDLTVTMVGNAGVLLSDGATTLLIDLPYEPGAHGYMHYDPSTLEVDAHAASVITHHHRDHFDPVLFRLRDGWQIVGPPSVTAGLPASSVLAGDSLEIGPFTVVTIPTPHTDDHRSYRIRWKGRVLHFVGDTEVPDHLGSGPSIDILFVTPWFSCAAADAGLLDLASRRIAYHLAPAGGDQICGSVEILEQGSSFTVAGSEL